MPEYEVVAYSRQTRKQRFVSDVYDTKSSANADAKAFNREAESTGSSVYYRVRRKAAKTSNPSRKRATKRKSNPRAPRLYYYSVVSGRGGTSLHGTYATKREAEAARKETKDRGYDYVRIKKGRATAGWLTNPSSIKSKSTPWIPVKAIRFRDGKLDMKVSKTVKRSLVAGDRLGNPQKHLYYVYTSSGGKEDFKSTATTLQQAKEAAKSITDGAWYGNAPTIVRKATFAELDRGMKGKVVFRYRHKY